MPAASPSSPRLWLVSFVAAALVVACGGDLPGSPYSDVAAAGAWLLAPSALGRTYGRWALLTFGVNLVVVAMAAEARWPGGREDPGPGVIVLWLPVLLLIVLAGAYSRRWRATKAMRRASVA